MADNLNIDAGATLTVATDDISGVHYQRVKIAQGADGSATDVSNAAPLNVAVASATLGTVTISGSVNVATATLGTVTITGNVNIASATLGTVTITGTTVVTSGNINVSSATLGTVTVSLANTGVTISMGRSLSTSSGTTTLTNTTLFLGGANKNKCYAFSLTTTSTTGVICLFTDGVSGTELWRVLLQAPSGANSGANLSVAPPAFLFATSSNGTLNLNTSTGVRVDWSVACFNEA